jgi:homogentisate 1,2-dioxygenase
MPGEVGRAENYQDIFHWAETQKDGAIPSFAVRKNDPYEVSIFGVCRYQILE